jgi:hypothetical protein
MLAVLVPNYDFDRTLVTGKGSVAQLLKRSFRWPGIHTRTTCVAFFRATSVIIEDIVRHLIFRGKKESW